MTQGPIHCSVYKCNRKSNYFLYVEHAEEFTRVPESLLAMLGELQHVIDVQLDDQRKLAQADVQLVMQQIHETGYYLQMPLDSKSKRQQ